MVSHYIYPGLKMRIVYPQNLSYDAQLEISLQIISTVCKYFKIKQEKLFEHTRTQPVSIIRHICIYLIREKTGMGLNNIGNLFSGRDHSTVLNSLKFVKTQLSIKKGESSIKKDITHLLMII